MLQIPFAGQVGDAEAYPEGYSEELVGLQVGEAGGGEEDSHDGSRGCDSEEDSDGSQHPLAVMRLMLEEEREGSCE